MCASVEDGKFFYKRRSEADGKLHLFTNFIGWRDYSRPIGLLKSLSLS